MARTFERATSTPFMEAMAAGNIAINGGMEVSQENGTTQITLATGVSKYVVDMFSAVYGHAANTAVIKAQQVAPPGSPAFGLGFPSCLQITSTTALSSPAAGDFSFLRHFVEGYRTAKLGFGSAINPQYLTIGFWIYATIAGIATVSIRNNAQNRAYLANFTVNAPTTWEYKTITIPVDTTGTWLTTTGNGFELGFCFGTGATLQGTNGVWQATNSVGTAATTNFFASNSNTVCITGLGVWPGTDAPTQARSPFAQRPFTEELTLCQRYYEKSFEIATNPAQNVGSVLGATYGAQIVGASLGAAMGSVKFAVRKRADPTITLYNPSAANAQIRNTSASSDWTATATASLGEVGFGIQGTTPAGSAAGQLAAVHWVADARL